MCGIAGIVTASLMQLIVRGRLERMETALVHRGPDDGESWIPESGLVGLAHRRLSILDLSPSGHQPMHSEDGRFTIVFNGEIFNFGDLRRQLVADGARLRSTGDTEVILKLYARRGAMCVDSLQGMFTFAIWDRDKKELFLARDPLGIKPLYVWQRGEQLAFASELRALRFAELGPIQINPRALNRFLLTGSVPEPETLIDGIEMLPPGTTCLWRDGQSSNRRYWDIDFGPANHADTISKSMDWSTAVDLTRNALQDSIERHFVSDVPVGIFLSGGIDSTALVSLARQQGVKDIQTFSIAFGESEFDEGDLAARTARHFGTDHHQWKMTSADGQSLFAGFLQAMDQPSNDGFNTYCVSKFAHDKGLKVVLSGLGGDELFGSYPSFHHIPQMITYHRWLRKLGPLSRGLAWILETMSPAGPRARAAEYLQSNGSLPAAYDAMRGFFTAREASILAAHYTGHTAESLEKDDDEVRLGHWSLGDQVSYRELTRYMRNQLLRDSDVMSMAWGLELRVPFVDRPFVDSVSAIPSSMRLAKGKRLLVEATHDIPQWIIDQPKRGFRFPFQQWLAADAAWSGRFRETLAPLPVKPTTWYQQWMLVILEAFISREIGTISPPDSRGVFCAS